MTNVRRMMMAASGVSGGSGFYAWGSNDRGQLGDGTVIARSVPVQIGEGETWISMAAGSDFSFGIRDDYTLWFWGRAADGISGGSPSIANTVITSSPVQIGSLSNWKAVVCANRWAFAVKTDGTLWAWGENTQGRLGDGTTIHRSSPVQIGSLTTWDATTLKRGANSASQAIKNDNSLWMWGLNQNSGVLGQPDAIYRSSPVQVGSLTNWSQASNAMSSMVANKTDGTLWTWGYSGRGALGDGLPPSTKRSSPVQVGSLTDWVDIGTMGQGGAIAVKTDGTLWTWGSMLRGIGGRNNAIDASSPIQVGSLTNWSKVSGNGSEQSEAYAIKTDGTLWMWGRNSNGGCGVNSVVEISSPVQVGSDTDWASVNPGDGGFTFGLKS